MENYVGSGSTSLEAFFQFDNRFTEEQCIIVDWSNLHIVQMSRSKSLF